MINGYTSQEKDSISKMFHLYSELSSANPNVLISKLSKPESFKKAVFTIHTGKGPRLLLEENLVALLLLQR